jgi:hypothetical protein
MTRPRCDLLLHRSPVLPFPPPTSDRRGANRHCPIPTAISPLVGGGRGMAGQPRWGGGGGQAPPWSILDGVRRLFRGRPGWSLRCPTRRWMGPVEVVAAAPTRSPWTPSPTTLRLQSTPTVTRARWEGCTRLPGATQPPSNHRSARCALGHDVERLWPSTSPMRTAQRVTPPTAYRRGREELGADDE